jgi:hypothetical protein
LRRYNCCCHCRLVSYSRNLAIFFLLLALIFTLLLILPQNFQGLLILFQTLTLLNISPLGSLGILAFASLLLEGLLSVLFFEGFLFGSVVSEFGLGDGFAVLLGVFVGLSLWLERRKGILIYYIL